MSNRSPTMFPATGDVLQWRKNIRTVVGKSKKKVSYTGHFANSNNTYRVCSIGAWIEWASRPETVVIKLGVDE